MEFLLLASAHFLALLSPGPDFFLIVQASLRLKLRYVTAICAGISLANGLYLIMAIIGLETIRELPLLALALKYLGAAYLIYIGVMLLRAPSQEGGIEQRKHILHKPRYTHQFLLGFLSGFLNPKNGIFYLSIFTVIVSPQTPLAVRALYGIWMISVVFVWDLFIGLCVGNSLVKNSLGKGIYYVQKLSGITLLSFGILLTF